MFPRNKISLLCQLKGPKVNKQQLTCITKLLSSSYNFICLRDMILNLVKIEAFRNIKEVSDGFFRRTDEHTMTKIEDVTTGPCTLDNPVQEK